MFDISQYTPAREECHSTRLDIYATLSGMNKPTASPTVLNPYPQSWEKLIRLDDPG
ncbi:MAG: hypothetical protein H5U01_00020 [Clostridia bacterium]|nr:hypothetical protein [Clostridia bacterium]